MLRLSTASTVVVCGPMGCKATTAVTMVLAEQSGLPIYSTESYTGKGHVDALFEVISHLGDEGWIVAGALSYPVLRRGPVTAILQLAGAKMPSKKILRDYVLLDGEEPRWWINAKSDQLAALLRIDGGPSGKESKD